MKADRQKIHLKFGGHCAYCGNEITLKQMQVDHVVPVYRGWDDKTVNGYNIKRGSEAEENLYPSCARCNRWKSTWNLEDFRREISLQIDRLNKYHNNYRMAKDFGLINETNLPVVFYFEKYRNENSNHSS